MKETNRNRANVAKRRARQRKLRNRRIALTVCLMLVVMVASIGGTVAWLTAKTDPVTNTFTYGDINIKLTETKPDNKQAKIIPGVNIEKDPKVTVEANSEACWLFVKIDEANWPTFTETDGTEKISYTVKTGDNGWIAGTGTDTAAGQNGVPVGVYYRKVDAVTEDTPFYVLAGDTAYPNGVVTVSQNLTKAEVNSVKTQPKLTFTAYAIQQEGFDTAAVAWAEASK